MTRAPMRPFFANSQSILVTVLLHVAIVLLMVGQWWTGVELEIPRGSREPIQAVVTTADDFQQQQARRAEQKQHAAIADALAQREAEQKRKQEQARAETERKAAEEQARAETERKAAAEQVRAEAEREAAAEQARAETERKAAEEQARAEAERKAAEEQARAEAERTQQEAQQLQAQTQRVKLEAAEALNALVDRIATAVENNWRQPTRVTSGAKNSALIRVKVAQSGTVLSARVVESSGDSSFDESAEKAVLRASPLPFPQNPKYYEYINEFNFRFKPNL